MRPKIDIYSANEHTNLRFDTQEDNPAGRQHQQEIIDKQIDSTTPYLVKSALGLANDYKTFQPGSENESSIVHFNALQGTAAERNQGGNQFQSMKSRSRTISADENMMS